MAPAVGRMERRTGMAWMTAAQTSENSQAAAAQSQACAVGGECMLQHPATGETPKMLLLQAPQRVAGPVRPPVLHRCN